MILLKMCTTDKSILFCAIIFIGGFELSNAFLTRLNNSISENEENKQEQQGNIFWQPKQKMSVLVNKNQTFPNTNNDFKISLNAILNHLQKCKQTANAVIWFSCHSNR